MIGSFRTHLDLTYNEVIDIEGAIARTMTGLDVEDANYANLKALQHKIRRQIAELEDQIGTIEDYAIEMYDR